MNEVLIKGVPVAQHVRVNPAAAELRELADAMPNASQTEFGNVNVQTRVVSRSKLSTFLVSEVPIEEVCTGPGKTSLAKGELVASFLLPKRPPRSGDAYLRFIPRTEMDIAVVGAGINLTLDEKGVCSHARVSIGAVAERALLVPEAAAALIGTKVDAEALKKMAAAVSAACRPIDDKRGTKEYRIKVSGVMARRAAEIALKRAREAN